MAIPETKLNASVKMREWFLNGTYDLSEAYLNGTMVFRKALELLLPDPQGDAGIINLRTFIDANNPDGFEVIVVVNNFIQPTITTGDLTGLEVELANISEIQGSSSGSDALIVTSTLQLTNTGTIRGAGGTGGTGGDGSSSSRSSGYWSPRGSYYGSPSYQDNVTSPDCVPNSVYHNRWWGPGSSGAWVMTGCTNQRFWSIGNLPNWGDQGDAHAVYGTTNIVSGNKGFSVLLSATQTFVGGGGGAGGSGSHFGLLNPASGTNGGLAYVSGINPGFNPSNGLNYTDIASILTSKRGGQGGSGGVWGSIGSQGNSSADNNLGTQGEPPGNAITGAGFLTIDSVIGTTVGTVQQ